MLALPKEGVGGVLKRAERWTDSLTAFVCQSVFKFFMTACVTTTDRRSMIYRGADKSLARPTSRCILFAG